MPWIWQAPLNILIWLLMWALLLAIAVLVVPITALLVVLNGVRILAVLAIRGKSSSAGPPP
jgi:hypothetical protein